ncbi:SRPBCC family protein [Rhizobium sp. P28RR-XV]|uniref:SRPBCC family protein n=1 Tax=Rhizobium sp. P28RR-XV TaxID=2726737 RepID=UPI0014575A43|nr:SRPBCC family protein [Rhizobium sp. P28RR-XV]NLR88411.1 SRPBCC family protein [Rhizobium sp. P28RR-XV]
MVKVIRSTILPAPIEEVWNVLRDFNGQYRWHPAFAKSETERGRDARQVGSIRKLTLVDGSELREQLLTLSEPDTAYSYCLLDTPVPLFNYVSHVRLIPVTDVDHTFWQCEGRFDTTSDQQEAMSLLVGTDIYEAGFGAIRAHMGLGG